MNCLWASPVGALVLASALQVFIFSCWLLPLAVSVVGCADRQFDMNCLWASPVGALVLASALQAFILSCWVLLVVAWAIEPCANPTATTAVANTIHNEPLIASPLRTLSRTARDVNPK